MTDKASDTRAISPLSISANPDNPRLYFNDESLDQLKTSIQEIGVLVPLIVYRRAGFDDAFVLLDGERRWKCAVELGLDSLPANIIPEPSQEQNILRMFNIHAVREEWPLVSIALSLRKVIAITKEDRESRLADMTGLTRSTVRRAKRLLTLPESELDLIAQEAPLDRTEQIHREDLYLEVEAAVSVLINSLEEIRTTYDRPFLIRQFVRKREEGNLRSVTDFRAVGKLVKAIGAVSRERVVGAARRLVEDVGANPVEVFEAVAAGSTERQTWLKRTRQLMVVLEEFRDSGVLDDEFKLALRRLRDEIDQVLVLP